MCTFSANDGQSGTETEIATGLSTPAECAYKVYTEHPSATGATFGVLGQNAAGKCWAEFGSKTLTASTVYTFCYLP